MPTRFIGDMYVSEVLGRPVLDLHGDEVGKLTDFVITLGELFPRVSGLVVVRRGSRHKIPWDDIGIFNKKVVSTRSPEGSYGKAELGPDEMLVCKNLLDKQIVDINGAKIVRVNDLKIGEVKGNLCLIAVDVGASGIFRRLGMRKRSESFMSIFGIKPVSRLISWNFLQPLEPKLSRLTLKVPRGQMGKMHPADIAQIISDVPRKDRQALVNSLDIETAAEAMHELEPGVQADLISDMDEGLAADILEAMPPDEAADLVDDLSEEKAQSILNQMEPEDAQDVQELLEHEDGTAGGLMTTEYLTFPPDMTVYDAFTEYRLEAPDVESASAYILYITDLEERLLGEVQLKDLVLASPKKTLGEIMRTDYKSALADEDEMETAQTMSKYNLLAIPVIDDDRRIIGIVTVDDVVDLVLPPQSRKRKHRIG